MKMANPDEKILSFNDVVLRRSDLDILSGPHFLNDRIIEFYLSYLSTVHPSPAILLVPPSVSFWISNCPDTESLKEFLEPLKLPDRNLVIFPVNDNTHVGLAEGGTHWSSLVFYRGANTFFHHDSNRGSNKQFARQLYKVVAPFLSGEDAMFREFSAETPQQSNGYDCGIFVLAVARIICQWFETAGTKNRDELWLSDVKEIVPGLVTHLREEVLVLITRFMAEKETR
ncbi:PREDICTED: NEDD8-specific protease 1 [Tarenaya hassleriana]|uniref:NEDD8-specific protease 1 n=1 Tax=Tarenaya hassleriana TaxID=28532 RepID=UPI00053C3D4F|nr:PREDICTED: NEDD8-specific protease 1 [Tarenaya hassleriana]XP_010520335.1 PREDICTED: NEDD8-specific protease 1 [Tarenaya hassleriana]XP_010520336.1 PREDICTED: NEDD8-specific protease 1 [Tarenaya hassleriana]XP_010520337.1 PREDICTED: NEDD8-specific protease 1 [Tarenaya hassleriana]XP_010520338.1 PREDICTED: NEDD8-specific protease 1 [Tarenaya hassleriana]XP_010520339.1 PREDICTED: NEDD8-specific protease 1 [Tarenaya hassleriana]